MDEKDKKKMHRIFVRIIILVIGIIVVGLLLLIFYPRQAARGPVSQAVKTISEKLEQAPADIKIQRNFVIEVIQDQERREFRKGKKNGELIDKAIEVASAYLVNTEDKEIHMALGRLYFQKAGIANMQADVVSATRNVAKGTDIFDEIENTEDIIFRAYRALNYSNLPGMFGKKDTAVSDFKTVAQRVLKKDYDLLESVNGVMYYAGMIVTSLKRGVDFVQKNKADEVGTIKEAYKKASVFAKTVGIEL